jgi:hypothetical protein
MHVTAAWPSVLPWMLVATGGILTCVALQRRGYRGAWALWLLLGGATAALLLGWLLG